MLLHDPRPAIRNVFRFNLLARLVLLVALAAVPAAIALLVLQWEIATERDQRAREGVLHQATLVNADIGSIVEGARQLTLAAARLPAVHALDPRCGADLAGLQGQFEQYAFLAVLDAAGRVVCASSGGAATEAAALVGQAPQPGASVGSIGSLGIGRFTPGAGGIPAVLPLVQPFTTEAAGTTGAGTLVAALSLDWLGRHLQALQHTSGSVIVVADRDAREIARLPPDPALFGQKLGTGLAPILSSAQPGTLEVRNRAGVQRVIGYVPATQPPVGLLVLAAATPAELIPGLARATIAGYGVVAAGLLLSIVLALVAGQRMLLRPIGVLLEAARHWEQGDLTARASRRGMSTTEFGALATAFDAMADALGRQQAELRGLNEALETRVAQRTHALLESNNRLQVVIAERERTEETLRQAQKLQALGQLAGGIAHDFNNLLTAVGGSLEMLRGSVPAGDARGQRLLATAIEAAGRGGRLTGQLLAFSHKQKLQPVATDINAVVNDMSALLATTLGPGVTVEARLNRDVAPALTDRNQLEAAIINLGLNARDAMATGGRVVIATTNSTITEADAEPGLVPGDYVGLTVIDHGVGMAPPVLARAFEPFFTTKAPGEGSGLGLSQVHGLAKQCGGTVRIASGPGAGTRVTILLPRAPATAAPEIIAVPEGPGTIAALAGAGDTILVVDDDAEVREVTAEILNEAGYAVLSAPGGEEALAAIRQEGSSIRLVIADFAMPGMNGVQLARAIRIERPGVPVLLATGYAELDPDAGKVLDGILRKPYRPAELLRRVARLLAAREPEAAV